MNKSIGGISKSMALGAVIKQLKADGKFIGGGTLKEVALVICGETGLAFPKTNIKKRLWRIIINYAAKRAGIVLPEPKQKPATQKEAKILTQRKTKAARQAFYNSKEWRILRYKALEKYGAKCQCCGGTPQSTGRPMHVDHIKPRSRFPHLELQLSNLQILCEDCNMGKGARSYTDWRGQEVEDELVAEYKAIMGPMN